MKWLDKMVHGVDVEVDRTMGKSGLFIQKYFAVFSITLLTLLLSFVFWRVWHSRPYVLSNIIAEDLAGIEKVLNRIDKECNILSIRSDRATIDFLTVQKFVGSTIGCLNLAYPERWKGPYLQINPSIQENFYEIVHAKDGYFVLPGTGVKLANGKEMGKDVIITHNTVVKQLLQPGGTLNFNGKAMGFRIGFKIGDWDAPTMKPDTVEKVNQFLREFNEALPFTCNDGMQGMARA